MDVTSNMYNFSPFVIQIIDQIVDPGDHAHTIYISLNCRKHQLIFLILNRRNLKKYSLPAHTMHTVSFDWFLSGSEWILNLELCLLKLLIFYQKLLWNIRSRLNFSTFWVFEPVFRYVWSKLKLFAQKMKILIKYI